jgi:arginyl-tRNA synthetase
LFSLKSWLQNYLHQKASEAISQWQSRKQNLSISPAEIPLQQVKQFHQTIYLSAIAFSLGKLSPLPPPEIAQKLAARIAASHCSNWLQVEVVSSGLLSIVVGDEAIAEWLQQLTQDGFLSSGKTPMPSPRKNQPSAADIFFLQYSHARCCSLIRLAHREAIITLKNPHPSVNPFLWQVRSPHPFPWLNPHQMLQLTLPAEKQALFYLVATTDAANCTERHPPPWHKLVGNLSEAFCRFHSQCRIFDETRTDNLYLAQARIGLVIAIHRLLHLFLGAYLHSETPLEL